jgi:hypothetical protein
MRAKKSFCGRKLSNYISILNKNGRWIILWIEGRWGRYGRRTILLWYQEMPGNGFKIKWIHNKKNRLSNFWLFSKYKFKAIFWPQRNELLTIWFIYHEMRSWHDHEIMTWPWDQHQQSVASDQRKNRQH